MEECYSEDREMEIVALQSIYGKLFTSWQQGDQSGNRFHYEVKFEEREIKIEFTIPGKSFVTVNNSDLFLFFAIDRKRAKSFDFDRSLRRKFSFLVLRESTEYFSR